MAVRDVLGYNFFTDKRVAGNERRQNENENDRMECQHLLKSNAELQGDELARRNISGEMGEARI